jgi:hypothetical protein
MAIEEGEEIQSRGTDNLFNIMIAENFLVLRMRESPRRREVTEHQTIRTKKETPPATS